jgi:hypothetical protein
LHAASRGDSGMLARELAMEITAARRDLSGC